MAKTLIKLFSTLFLIVFLISFVSAYVDYNSYSYSSTRTTGSSYGWQEQKTVNYNKQSETIYTPYGKETRVSYNRVVSEKTIPVYRYGNSCNTYYYDYDCSGYPPSNFRNRNVYNSADYTESYTMPYYHKPMVDNSGAYNWRY